MTDEAWDGLVALPDGRVVELTTPVLRADDGAAARGDGCFETLLAVDGVVRDLPEHLQRLRRSAAALRLTAPDDRSWSAAVEALLDRARGTAEVVLRLQLGRGAPGTGESWFATATPIPAESVRQRSTGVRVLVLERGHDPAVTDTAAPWLLLGAKTLSYAVNMAALRHATEHGADDVLFTAGRTVLEGPRSSFVLLTADGVLVSPPPVNILDGITLQRLLTAAAAAGRRVERRPVDLDEVGSAAGIWLTSSVRLLTQVRSLDGRPLAYSEMTEELAGLLDVPGCRPTGS